MTTGKDVDSSLAEAGSTVEMAEALRASGAVDDLLAQIDSGEVALTGEGGQFAGLDPAGPGTWVGCCQRSLKIDPLRVSGIDPPGGRSTFREPQRSTFQEPTTAAELTDHLGYEKTDPAGRALPNARNGSSPKTVQSEAGPVPLDVPRDRDGSFTPHLVPKGSRRLGGLDEMIISLYAGGMTLRNIQFHLASTIGTEVSHETISQDR